MAGRKAGGGQRGEMDTTLTEGGVRGQWAEKYRGYWAQQPSNDNSDKCDGSVVTWIKV